jgi:hypothetical protein
MFKGKLRDFLNPALALLGQGLKKSPIGQKLDFLKIYLTIFVFYSWLNDTII